MIRNLYLVRHAEPEDGYTGKYLGRLNPALSPRGVEQAKHIAGRIAALNPSRIVASPLRRAVETADIVAGVCGLPVEQTDLLLEIDFGELEGKTFKEATALYPDVADSWRALSGDFSFPGGEDYATFEHRVAQLAGWTRALPGGNAVLIAHGGVLRGLMCNLLDIPANGPLRFRLAYATIASLELHPNGAAVLTAFNVGGE